MSKLQLRHLAHLKRRYYAPASDSDGITQEEWKKISDTIYKALLPFDEARWAVAAALMELDKQEHSIPSLD